MDPADRAQRINEFIDNAAIDAARKALTGDGAAECIDCGEPIPAERRQAAPHAVRCIGCQTEYETR